MENPYPERKYPRLKYFDYSTPRAYFVTICTHDRRPLLSRVCETNGPVPRDGSPAKTDLTPCGRIAEEELLALTERWPGLTVLRYALMPDHIHALILLPPTEKSPDLRQVVGAFKSLTANRCRTELSLSGVFQRSFYEHVIRDRTELEQAEKYIADNPAELYFRGPRPTPDDP